MEGVNEVLGLQQQCLHIRSELEKSQAARQQQELTIARQSKGTPCRLALATSSNLSLILVPGPTIGFGRTAPKALFRGPFR